MISFPASAQIRRPPAGSTPKLLAAGVSYRDDSILVDWLREDPTAQPRPYAVPSSFWRRRPKTPRSLELEHYGIVKRMGNWDTAARFARWRNFSGDPTAPDYFRVVWNNCTPPTSATTVTPAIALPTPAAAHRRGGG